MTQSVLNKTLDLWYEICRDEDSLPATTMTAISFLTYKLADTADTSVEDILTVVCKSIRDGEELLCELRT